MGGFPPGEGCDSSGGVGGDNVAVTKVEEKLCLLSGKHCYSPHRSIIRAVLINNQIMGHNGPDTVQHII